MSVFFILFLIQYCLLLFFQTIFFSSHIGFRFDENLSNRQLFRKYINSNTILLRTLLDTIFSEYGSQIRKSNPKF